MLTPNQNRNVVRLAVAQALSMTSMNVNIINTALVGVMLAPMAWLATLPLSLQFLTSMMVTLPASLLMSRYGRRPILIAGVLCSSLSTLCLGVAVVISNFPLFCAGGMGLGAAMGIAGYYRYAAADGVLEDQRPKAISYVLAGGLAAAILGPEIARRTVDVVPDFLYAGCFFTVAVVQLASLIALWGIRIEKPRRTPTGGRPIGVFLRMPVFVVGVTCCAIGYALMSYLMTATPLQVVNVAKLGTSANATIIQWHVVAMFLPSFFTGHIIARLGAFRVLWTGVLFYGTTIFLAVSASGFWGYWLALATLGLGWNFLFIGGTSLVARVAEPEERGRVQGLADLVTMTTVAAASLSAGAIHSQLGWQAVSLAALGPVLIVSMSLIWLGLSSQKQIMGSQGR
ncbi:MAG: MFS transporter [Pseudomonadota bacterium]|nr:MFS transporter [Pseudomonadota bacterium]